MRKMITSTVALALAVGGLSFGCDKNRDDDMAGYGGTNRDMAERYDTGISSGSNAGYDARTSGGTMAPSGGTNTGADGYNSGTIGGGSTGGGTGAGTSTGGTGAGTSGGTSGGGTSGGGSQ